MSLEMPNGNVAKSFIPPKVPGGVGQYVPATQMGVRRLRQTVRPGMYTPRPMGEDALAQSFRDQAPMRRMIMERGQAPQMSPHPVPRGETPTGDGMTAVPVQPKNLRQRVLFPDHETSVHVPAGQAAPAVRQGRTNISLNVRDDVTAGTGGIASRYGGRSSGVSTIVLPRGGAPGMNTAQTIQHEMAHATPNRSSWRLHQVLNDSVKHGREEARADMASGLNHVRAADPGHVSGYHAGARSRSQARGLAAMGLDRDFFRGYRQQHNTQAGNTPIQRLFGNPQNRRDLATGAGVGGLGAYEYNRRREEVGKSMSLEMPNGNVSKSSEDVEKALRSDEPKVRRGMTTNSMMRVGSGGMAVAAPDSLHAERKGTSLIRRRPKYRVTAHPGESALRSLTEGGGKDDSLYLQRKRAGLRRSDRKGLSRAISSGADSYKGMSLSVSKRATMLRPGRLNRAVYRDTSAGMNHTTMSTTTGRKPNPFYTPRQTTQVRTTSWKPGTLRTSQQSQTYSTPGSLTRTGRRAVGAAGGAAVGGGAAAGIGAYRNRDGVAKRGIIKPIKPPATGVAPSTPTPPKPSTGVLRPSAAQGPRKPRMPKPPTLGGSTR